MSSDTIAASTLERVSGDLPDEVDVIVVGLHVADASVMPTIPRANTHAPTIMIAERSVQLMRKAVSV